MMLEISLAIGLVLYGLLSLAWIIAMWPAMREQERRRKEAYEAFVTDAITVLWHDMKKMDIQPPESKK